MTEPPNPLDGIGPLTSRLKLAAIHCVGRDPEKYTAGVTCADAKQAADLIAAQAKEIERLRDENERVLAANRDLKLHWDVLKADYDAQAAEIARLRAENERLKEQRDIAIAITLNATPAQAGEIVRLRSENDKLRALPANAHGPCIYCGLSKDSWGECASGFPGCDRADDAMLCPHVGSAMDSDEDNARLREENAKLRSALVSAEHHIAYGTGDGVLTGIRAVLGDTEPRK